MPSYSHSRLSTFEQCNLKFKFKYIDKVETDAEESVEAFLGKKVHETLEKLYSDLKFEKLNTLKELLAFFKDEWKKSWTEDIIIVKEGITEENYFNMGERFIISYYNRYKPFKQATVIGTEVQVRLKLNGAGTEHNLIGYIDRLDYKEDGTYEVHDYKTNSNLPLQEYLNEDRQLALYALAVKGMYPDAKKIKLVWHFLAFDREMASERTDEELEALKWETVKLIEQIETEKEFKPKVSKLCDWCEFKPVCPMWKHLYRLEEKPANEYLKDTGVQLVNRYAELNAKKKRLLDEMEEELEKLKEAIVKFAEKEKVSVVFGSNAKAGVKVYEAIKFPPKAEQGELINLLKKAGRWEEISTLDAYALARIVKEEKWPKQLLEKLKDYEELERVERIYLSKIKDKDK
ncbi:PD-(D/E)XK nuclease family protein [Candidatus Woesearchaeota archaeon]|nr:PD-(D/E)XK nuclease family protein [Candidatus Woesearchaeota archaeon]